MADYSSNMNAVLNGHLGLPIGDPNKEGDKNGTPKLSGDGPIAFLNSYFESPEFKKRFLLRNSEDDYNNQMDTFKKFKSSYKPYVLPGNDDKYIANNTNREGFKGDKYNGIPQGTNIILGKSENLPTDSDVVNKALPHEYSHLMRDMSFEDQVKTGELNSNQEIFKHSLKEYHNYMTQNAVYYPNYSKKGFSQWMSNAKNSYGLDVYKPGNATDENIDLVSKLHDSTPDEQYSDLNTLRWMMYKDGIYDTRKGNMTPDDLKKALQNPKISNDFTIKRLLNHFNPKELILFNNTVAFHNTNRGNNVG